MQNIGKNQNLKKLGMTIVHSLFNLFVLFSSIWLCIAIWFQEPISPLFSKIIIGFWIGFALSILGIHFCKKFLSRTKSILIYSFTFLCALIWYFSIPPLQDREWNPDVAKSLSFEQRGDIVTLHNVRNFTWRTEQDFDEKWETRTFNLNDLSGVNIITSYWMGPEIAHTLVSFDFKNSAPLTFSIEIRKEKTEDFSALGGFFRKFELSLIAADEKDIIYTRSNVRGEQVYFFPVAMPKPEMRALFEEYLKKSAKLEQEAKWYNTLTSNCTTLVFDMIQSVSNNQLPVDYRLLASGYLPNYLYDLNALNHDWSMKTWYEKAHVNPKVKNIDDLTSEKYSKIIREQLLKPKSQAD